MESTQWIPLKNYENYYEISEQGKIRSLHKKNLHLFVKQRIDRAGYLTVRLSKNKEISTHSVHKLLAQTFISNPTDKRYINHKDGNKLNNSLSNLEWVTHAENIKHAYTNKLCKVPEQNCKKVIDTCTDTEYRSISEAARALDITYSTCKNYLNGRRTNPTCLRYAA